MKIRYLPALAVAAAAAFSATNASAMPYVCSSADNAKCTLDTSDTDTSGTFGRNIKVAANAGSVAFSDSYTFHIGIAETISVQLLYGALGLTVTPANFTLSGGNIVGNKVLSLSNLNTYYGAAGDYVVSVAGFAHNPYGTGKTTSSYIGLISVASVPESLTWAMMLLGLGFAGYALRRRQQPSVSFAF